MLRSRDERLLFLRRYVPNWVNPHQEPPRKNSGRASLHGPIQAWRGPGSLLFHQHLTKLQAVAGWIAKRGELDHARNFFNLTFEFDAARLQTFALALNIVHAENNCCARLFAGLGIRRHPDGRLALGVAKFRPALSFEGFLEAQDVAIEFLGFVEILHVEPGNSH